LIPQTAIGIKVACFEISQDAGSKTDYRHIIPHESLDAALTTRLERELTAVHRSLASKLPRREVIVLFPSRDSASDQPLFCLCRCATVDRAGSRPFLRLQAIVGSPAQVRSEGADPLVLFDSPVWDRISENRVPVDSAIVISPAAAAPENGSVALAEQAAAAFRQRRPDPLLLEMPDDTRDSKRARETLRSALALLNEAELASVSLGIGIPAGCSLPTRPAVVVPEPAASSAEPAPRGLPDSYLYFLRRLAVDLSEQTDVSALWRQRLWNKTQDLLALAEEFGRRASPAPRSTPAGMQGSSLTRGVVHRRDMDVAATASLDLAREMGRAGLSRKAGDLEKQTGTFLDYLLPSLKDDPRTSRGLSPMAALLIVIAAIAGGLGVYFWQSTRPGPVNVSSKSPENQVVPSKTAIAVEAGGGTVVKSAIGVSPTPNERHPAPRTGHSPKHSHG